MSIEQFTPRSEVVISSPQDAAIHRLGEWATSADAAFQVAQRLSGSAFVPQQFRDKPVELTAAILAGLEVGLSPMAAIRSFDIIQGQAAARAITLRAIVQSAGHEMELVESTATRCRMRGRRRGAQDWQTVTWTMDRARDLKLDGKDNWRKQPGAMLVARATSELARLIASDAILGIGYTAEELNDGATGDAVTIPEQAQAPSGSRRMSRRKTEPADTPAPERDEEGQMKAMHAAFNDAGITERQDRLDFAMATVNREIESSADLTWDERSAVIDALRAATDTDVVDAEFTETEAPA